MAIVLIHLISAAALVGVIWLDPSLNMFSIVRLCVTIGVLAYMSYTAQTIMAQYTEARSRTKLFELLALTGQLILQQDGGGIRVIPGDPRDQE